MVNGFEQQQLLAAFEAKHGQTIWHGCWGFTADGCEIEAGSLGYRPLEERPPERQRENKTMYWRLRLEDLTREFHAMKEELQFKAETASLKPEDTAALKALQTQVQEAAKQLDVSEHPPGPDVKAVRAAKRLYAERSRLASACGEAEKTYKAEEKRAAGRQSQKLIKLGQEWESAWGGWDDANQRYQAIDEAVRKQAEDEIYREEREARVLEQTNELESIEI